MLQAAKDFIEIINVPAAGACFSRPLIIAVKYAEFLSFPTTLSLSYFNGRRWLLLFEYCNAPLLHSSLHSTWMVQCTGFCWEMQTTLIRPTYGAFQKPMHGKAVSVQNSDFILGQRAFSFQLIYFH